MSDPKRLLEDVTLGEAERAALRAGKALRGDEARREAIWAAIAPALPPVSTVPDGGAELAGLKAAGASGGAATGAGWLGFVKASAVGAGVMGALLAGQTLMPPRPPVAPGATSVARVEVPSPRREEAASGLPGAVPEKRVKPVTTPSVPAPRVVAPPREAPAPEPANEVPPGKTPTPEAPQSAAPAAGEDRMARYQEEARLVREVDQALRRGQASEALRLLGELNQRFPGGLLVEEREVLSIEALARGGQQEQARSRAEAFLTRRPTSPFAGRLRALTGL
jgi:hypothetical protein